MARPDHYTIRSMSFVDGENLVFRFQDMLDQGRKQNPSIQYRKDVYVWHQHMTGDYFKGQFVRANYYTHVAGPPEMVDTVRDELGKITTDGAGYGRRVSGHVFWKSSSSK